KQGGNRRMIFCRYTVIQLPNKIQGHPLKFNREADGSLKSLPAKHVDTGMDFRQRTHIAAGKRLRKCDCSSRSEIGLSEGHIHYYINDDSNKDVITVGYSSANAVPINFGMNCGREHKRASLVASHCLKIAEYMGAEHEQIATAVDSTINVKTNGDIMTLIVGAAIIIIFLSQYMNLEF
ncbi:hypothetical protein RYX36_008132, partial [Vicia faba]